MVFLRNPVDVRAGIDASKTTYDQATGRESSVTTESGETLEVSYSSDGGVTSPTYKSTISGEISYPYGTSGSRSIADTSITSPIQPVPTTILTKELGTITSLNHSFSGDEIVVKVTVLNTSNKTQEYRAYLYDSSGTRVDKEPDLYWANVRAGQQRTFTLSSKWKLVDIKSLGGAYRVAIHIQGGIFVDEKVVNLGTGKVTSPESQGEGTFRDPDTAPAVGDISLADGEFVSDTPVAPKGTSFWDKLAVGGLSATTVVLIGGVIYLLGKSKK